MSKKIGKSVEELLAEVMVPEEEQPHIVPNNWVWTKLGAIVEFKGGGTPSKTKPYFWNGGIPWATVKDVKSLYLENIQDSISEDGLKNSSASIAEPNELLLITRMSPGKCTITKVKTAINQDLKIVRPLSDIPVFFLWIYFVLNTPMIEHNSSGSTVKGIQVNKLNEMKIPLPPLNEQKRIADKVETLLDKINQAKKLIEEAKETFELRRASILDKAFRGELTARWRKQHGLGMDSWEETTLQEHTSKLGDGIHGTPKYSDEGEFYFINGNNLDGYSIVIKPNTKRVDIEEYNIHKKNLSSQTVFVSINGTLGKTAFYNGEPIILGKSACYFNVKDTLDKRFIRYYLLTQKFHNYAQTMATGSTIKNLSLKAMRNLPLKVPSFSEQQEIVRLLDNLFDKEDRMIEICDVNEKIDLIIKAVLYQAFRGELGTNDPAEESAMNLLEDILKSNN